MKPSCSNCNKEMEFTTAGVVVGNVVPMGPDNTPTLYQVWHGDEYTCTDCKAKVVARFAERPIWERHHKEPAPNVDRMILSR